MSRSTKSKAVPEGKGSFSQDRPGSCHTNMSEIILKNTRKIKTDLDSRFDAGGAATLKNFRMDQIGV